MRRLGGGIPVVLFVFAVAGGAFNETNAVTRAASAAERDGSILGRTLILRTDGRTPACDVVFRSGDDKREDTVTVPAGVAEKALAVPHYARRFVVRIGGATSGSRPLSTHGGGETIVKVSLREKAWSGWRRAVGFDPSSDYEVVLEAQAR
jgi:hypothetical protein